MSVFAHIRNLHPKTRSLVKFSLLLCVFLAYFGYLSWQYDIATGGLLAALSWSFFVLCTPIADAGFLLDFPVRLITNIRMIHSEMGVWGIAFALNGWALNFAADVYQKSFITKLLHKVLTTPWPYWGIIVLCALGTFISIWFGDEIMDAVGNKSGHKKHHMNMKLKIGLTASLFAGVFFAYYFLLQSLGIDISKIEG